jgi:hypothetical protein
VEAAEGAEVVMAVVEAVMDAVVEATDEEEEVVMDAVVEGEVTMIITVVIATTGIVATVGATNAVLTEATGMRVAALRDTDKMVAVGAVAPSQGARTMTGEVLSL